MNTAARMSDRLEASRLAAQLYKSDSNLKAAESKETAVITIEESLDTASKCTNCCRSRCPWSQGLVISYRRKEKWDLFILVLAIVNSFTVPLELVFDNFSWLEETWYSVLDTFVDVMFLIDLVLMFWTTFRSKTGKEVWEQGAIAMNYCKSLRFFTDIGSILGSSLVTMAAPPLKPLGLFKLARIRRVRAFVSKLNADEMTKTLYQILRSILELVLFIHVQACIWFYVTAIDGRRLMYAPFAPANETQWYPPLNFVNAPDSHLFEP